MTQRDRIVTSLLLSTLVLFAQAPAQTGDCRVKPGDSLPRIAGQALTGEWLDLPSVAGGSPAVVIFSFSRAGGRDAQNWTQNLSKDDPHLAIYTVIFLESVPRLFRAIVVSEIKGGMPIAIQDRTVLLYQDESLWKRRLQITDESHACVILIRPDGHIQWMTSEPFAGTPYLELRKQIRALN
jgi:hypothetical protein